jgi:hypothetical protein
MSYVQGNFCPVVVPSIFYELRFQMSSLQQLPSPTRALQPLPTMTGEGAGSRPAGFPLRLIAQFALQKTNGLIKGPSDQLNRNKSRYLRVLIKLMPPTL